MLLQSIFFSERVAKSYLSFVLHKFDFWRLEVLPANVVFYLLVRRTFVIVNAIFTGSCRDGACSQPCVFAHCSDAILFV